jgi:nucleoside-diphosphate-sugar epimerase
MRIFVAGATGALGAPLVEHLVAAGHDVVGLTRSASKRELVERLGARPVVADVLDASAIARVVAEARPQTVVHALTALPKRGPRRARDLEATNVVRTQGTRNLVGAAQASGARRFVAESIVIAYGQRIEGAALIEETHARVSRGPPDVQPAIDAIAALEDEVLGAAPGLEPIVLRFGFFYGAMTGSTQDALAMIRARKLPAFGAADSAVPWVHVDDAARATALAIDRGTPGGIYNIVDDAPTAFGDFVREAARAIGAPRPRSAPLWLVRLLMPYAASIGSMRLRVSNAKAKRDLGWQPRFASCREGLASLV